MLESERLLKMPQQALMHAERLAAHHDFAQGPSAA